MSWRKHLTVLLLVSLFAASCGDTTIGASNTLNPTPATSEAAEDEAPSTTAAAPTTPERATSTTGLTFTGYVCVGQGSPVIEPAEFDQRADWPPAPDHLIAQLLSSDTALAAAGDWRMWPADAFAILLEPISTETLWLASISLDGDVKPCLATTGDNLPPVPPIHCWTEPGTIGPTVYTTGVAAGTDVRYLVDNTETAVLTSRGVGGDGTIEHAMWIALHERAGIPHHLDDSEPTPQYSSVFDVVWLEPGDSAAVTIEIPTADGLQVIDCGQANGLTADDYDLTCTVRLEDGYPVLTVANDKHVPFDVLRDGIPTDLQFFGPIVDINAPRNQTVSYTITGALPHGDPFTHDCGSVDVPAEATLVEQLIQAELAATNSLAGPHIYWRLSPTCPRCEYEPLAVYLYALDDPIDHWGLPAEHPGIIHPTRIHQHLVDAIHDGHEVAATIDSNGLITNWTIDGYGVASDCLIVDTSPPEDVPTGSPQHCSYQD